MGKSAAGAIWLNDDRLSTFDFWQFWRNTEDADVERFLGLFTELPMDEVRRLGALEGAEINAAKIVLADEATRLCHSGTAADHAKATAVTTFGKKGMGDGLPQFGVTAAALGKMDIIGALTTVGFAKSNGEARRLVRGGGARINYQQITDEATPITAADFYDGRAKISAGKKRHALLVLG